MKKENFSIKGWKWSEWLKGHWKTMKEVGKVMLPYYAAWLAGLDPQVSALVAAGAAGLLSAVEYYVKPRK